MRGAEPQEPSERPREHYDIRTTHGRPKRPPLRYAGFAVAHDSEDYPFMNSDTAPLPIQRVLHEFADWLQATSANAEMGSACEFAHGHAAMGAGHGQGAGQITGRSRSMAITGSLWLEKVYIFTVRVMW